MMMIPRRKNEFDIFDDMFKDPFWGEHEQETKLMKTDIREKDDKYLIDIELPGYEKENIKMDVTDGYLNIRANIVSNKEEKENGKFIRKEIYSGSCSRSFYVGEDVTNEDIKANFKNGMLKIEIPKKEHKEKVPEIKYIEIGD